VYGDFPLVLSGESNTTPGTISALGSEEMGVVWLVRRPLEFNTPETTTSGFREGEYLPPPSDTAGGRRRRPYPASALCPKRTFCSSEYGTPTRRSGDGCEARAPVAGASLTRSKGICGALEPTLGRLGAFAGSTCT